MNKLICEYYELKMDNLQLAHQIELKNLENRLKSDYEAKKALDVSGLRNKIEHLE